MQKASSKILALIIGAVAVLAVFGVIVFIMTRPDQPASQPPNGIITADDLKSVKEKTVGLKNFGDLPIIVTKDEVGRSNPFESY